MAAISEPARKRERLGLRASERQRALLLAASEAEGTTMSEFVLRHATEAAENVLADRRVFVLPDPAWAAFTAALDRPARANAKLRKLLATPSVLDDDARAGA